MKDVTISLFIWCVFFSRLTCVYLRCAVLSGPLPFLQEKVKAAVDCFIGATHLVNEMALFSRNEELDEVHTEHLK